MADRHGAAWRLQWHPATPLMIIPFTKTPLSPSQMFIFASVALFSTYALYKGLIVTRFGRAVIAVKENEMRAELLGYNAKRLKLAVFVISAGTAGLAGLLFANSVFVSPTMFSLSMAAQVLIWVVVGGLGTLFGPVAACFALQMATTALGKLGLVDPNIVLGLVLIILSSSYRAASSPPLQGFFAN